MHYRQGLYRRYVSDIDQLLRTMHQTVCSENTQDAATKENERLRFEAGIFPPRDLVTAARPRVKRWEDEKEGRDSLPDGQ